MQSFAKQPRCEATDAERLLWRHLRARRLSGFKFRRQMAIEPYIVDFACLEARLVIEADGGQHGEQLERDQCRTAFLEARGYRVLRFWNHEILTQTRAVLEQIHRELIQSPHPNPSRLGFRLRSTAYIHIGVPEGEGLNVHYPRILLKTDE